MPSTAINLSRRDVFYMVVAALLVLLYVNTANGGFPLDDSWIHQVYARNLADFGEWSFVPGEPSAASTSPLFTVLLAVGYVLNVDYALWVHLLGALALGASGILAARLADRLLPYETMTAFFVGLAVVVSWHLVWAAAAGMETMLFSMFTLLLIWLTWREGDLRFDDMQHIAVRGAIFGVASALAMLTRPEGVVLAGLCGGMMLLLRLHGLRHVVIWGGGAAVGFLVFVAPYILLNLSLAGSILPATSDAKYAQHLPLLDLSIVLRLLNLIIPIIVGGHFLLLPGVAYFGVRTVKQAQNQRVAWLYLLPLLWVVVLLLLYALRLPAGYQHGRYVMPLLPALVVVGCVGTITLARRVYQQTIPRVVTLTLLLSAVGAFAYFGLILGADVYRQDVQIIDEEMVAVAQWIAVNIPDDDLLAVHDIGAVGYFATRPILDLAGLVSPEVVPIYHDGEALWALLSEEDARYMMAFPDQVPGDDPDDPRLCPVFQSDGRASTSVGGPKMTVYTIEWSQTCP